MARRKAAATEPTEDTMESDESMNDQVEQSGDDIELDMSAATDEGDPPAEVRDLDAEELALKLQLQEIRKLKKEAKKGTKTNGSKPQKVAKEKTPRAPRDEANGVTRPATGVTKQVWDTADLLSNKLGTFVDRATLSDALTGKIEIGTVHTQYGRWRKYYGISETAEQRTARLEQIKAKKLADLGMAPQAEEQGEPGEATQ